MVNLNPPKWYCFRGVQAAPKRLLEALKSYPQGDSRRTKINERKTLKSYPQGGFTLRRRGVHTAP